MALMTFKAKLRSILLMIYRYLKALLFTLPPETAHNLALSFAHLGPDFGKLGGFKPSERLKIKLGQNHWHFPAGLAAGLDKNAQALKFFAYQGFGALECGTITLKPQVGNPGPRLFRYPKEQSLRNSMGFPNHGLVHIASRLHSLDLTLPIGANIGKNKDSSTKESITELATLVGRLHPDVDYFVVNVSSPNTPGLRELQEKTYLLELFKELKSISQKDFFLKIAPDLSEDKVLELAYLASELNLAGLMATNTTIMPEFGPGGVSGNLLRPRAKKIHQLILKQNLPIDLIGVGGFSSFQDLKDFWFLGGKCIQVYTAYIYQGPALLKKIQQETIKFLDHHQLNTLEDFFKLDLKERQNLLNYPA